MHTPVLLKEVIDYLNPKANENFVDCTIGQGGHTKSILERTSPSGRVLGIDWDKKQIENCKLLKEQFGERLIVVNDNYVNLSEILKNNNFENISGILLDVGFSSFQIEDSKMGFSFLRDEYLNMSYNEQNDLTAEIIINQWSENEIEEILTAYGEEKFSRQIAKKITDQRKISKIQTTFQLVEIIKKAIPLKYQHNKIHFATRTFQALRIAVNKELENLQNTLPQAISVLNKGGIMVVISFHSLEDRIVKNFFRDQEKNNLIKILTKKPITSTDQEIAENPRSRSAKLRAVIKKI